MISIGLKQWAGRVNLRKKKRLVGAKTGVGHANLRKKEKTNELLGLKNRVRGRPD